MLIIVDKETGLIYSLSTCGQRVSVTLYLLIHILTSPTITFTIFIIIKYIYFS